MATLPHLPPMPEVHYPESDGEPMAETDTHWQATADLALMLKDRYRDAADVYVASDNFIYYEEGNPRAALSPDVYVVFGVPKRLRRIYKLWEEGQSPAVVFEMTSRGTRQEDLGSKRALCARLGVREYWLFDPELDYLHPALQGYRLEGDQYLPIARDAEGALESTVLGLTLVLDGDRLAVLETSGGERLLRPDEVQHELRALRAARGAAEAELARLRDEIERLRRGESGTAAD